MNVLTVEFIAKAFRVRDRFCYWNGPGRPLLDRMRRGSFYIPAYVGIPRP